MSDLAAKRQYSAIGVTGTRAGMTHDQRSTIARYLRTWRDSHGAIELHHGDCVGVDAGVAALAATLAYRIVCHPPTITRHRAYVRSHETLPAADYLVRNRRIVDTADLMVACPRTATECKRSGTWATIRYARESSCPLVVLGPDGKVVEFSGFSGRNTHVE